MEETERVRCDCNVRFGRRVGSSSEIEERGSAAEREKKVKTRGFVAWCQV